MGGASFLFLGAPDRCEVKDRPYFFHSHEVSGDQIKMSLGGEEHLGRASLVAKPGLYT